MPSMNQVVLMGHLGKDAETAYTQSGSSVTKFSLATSRSYKKGEEWVKETTWHNIVAWAVHENLTPLLLKGSLVTVTGRIENRSYEKDGITRYVTEIIADKVMYCRPVDANGQPRQQGAPHKGSDFVTHTSPAQRQQAPRQMAPPDMYNDDVPF